MQDVALAKRQILGLINFRYLKLKQSYACSEHGGKIKQGQQLGEWCLGRLQFKCKQSTLLHN